MNKTREAILERSRRSHGVRANNANNGTRLYDVQNCRISLKQWRMLHAVVDCGGYSDAAEFLHLSQSAISYTIGKLQDQLGIPLLKVEGRKAHITEEGRMLLQRSRGLLKAALELEAYAENLRKGWRSDVRLVVEHRFPSDLLMLALRKFSTSKPDIRIQLDEVAMPQVEEVLNAHAADLAICSEVPLGFLGDPLIELKYVAVARPDHPLFSLGRAVEALDLERHVQIVVCHPNEPLSRDERDCSPDYVRRWYVGSFDSAFEALQAGLGYAWLPWHRVRKHPDDRLAVLPIQDSCSYKTNFYLVHGRPWVTDASVRKLAEVLHGLASARTASGEDDSLFYPMCGESA